jgi:hypothetical protein
MISQPPEVNPAETVTITPLVSDINETVGLSYSAYSCMDSGIALGAEPTCVGSPSQVILANNVSISTLAIAHAFTGIANGITINIPNAQTLLNLRSPAQKYNGISYIFEYVLQNSRGEQVKSIKRILVSDSAKTNKNTNPDIIELLFNGTVVVGGGDLPLSVEVATSLTFNGSPVEAYQKMNNELQLTDQVEDLVTTWFITDGKVNYQRTTGFDSNSYEGPSAMPSGRPSYMIGVVRDGRGGSDYIIKCFGTCN